LPPQGSIAPRFFSNRTTRTARCSAGGTPRRPPSAGGSALDLFGLPSTARHLVERVEQPVGVTDEVEPRSGVVLETVADVQIEQLGRQKRGFVDAVHGVADGDDVSLVGDQLREADADGAQPFGAGRHVLRGAHAAGFPFCSTEHDHAESVGCILDCFTFGFTI